MPSHARNGLTALTIATKTTTKKQTKPKQPFTRPHTIPQQRSGTTQTTRNATHTTRPPHHRQPTGGEGAEHNNHRTCKHTNRNTPTTPHLQHTNQPTPTTPWARQLIAYRIASERMLVVVKRCQAHPTTGQLTSIGTPLGRI